MELDREKLYGLVGDLKASSAYGHAEGRKLIDDFKRGVDFKFYPADLGDDIKEVMISTIGTLKERLKGVLEGINKASTEEPTRSTDASSEEGSILLPEPVQPLVSYDGIDYDDVFRNLERQFEGRIETMRYFEIIPPFGSPRYKVGEVEYVMPDFEAIAEVLKKDRTKMELIETLKKPRLIVTPIGMPLATLAEKVASKRGRMTGYSNGVAQNSVNMVFSDNDVVYFPDQFVSNAHGGKLKKGLIRLNGPLNRFPGWQVLIVDGRQEIRADDRKKDANAFLQEWKRQGYAGITPEEALMLHAEGVIDPVDNNSFNTQSDEMLLGSFLLGSLGSAPGIVPTAMWNSGSRYFRLSGINPEDESDIRGPRRAVRVM